MSGPIAASFTAEHRALTRLLEACLTPGGVDAARFDTFRQRVLHHIAVEEKVLLPALERKLGRRALLHNALRRDHAGIAALCVPAPNRDWVESLMALLEQHHRVEEDRGGFFAECDAQLRDELPALFAAVEALPPLQLAPFTQGRRVRDQLAEVMLATGITS